MVTHMSEKEYSEFKKKSGHREPQKVTTYYKEAREEEEAKKHHKERVGQNKDKRSIMGRVEQKVTGSHRVTTAVRHAGEKVGGVKKKVISKAKRVTRSIAPITRGVSQVFGGISPPAKSSSFHFAVPSMPPSAMMGPYVPVTHTESRRTRRKPGRRQYEEREEPASYRDMMEVPDSVKRWMF